MDVNRGIEVGLENIPRTKVDRLEELTETRWQELANCVESDPNIFFPENKKDDREAKEICKQCDVRTECLEFSLQTNQEVGIWGGKNEDERRRMRRQLRVSGI